jgi:nitroreductase
MDALDLLLKRESAMKLASPGPTPQELDRIFASAVRAPDHGRLRPWHFVVIDEAQRGAFGDLLVESLRRHQPDAPAEMLRREREKAFRSPCIVAVAAKVKRGHKIPEIEQLGSGFAAAQTVLLAANALGYGAVWKTGGAAYDPAVKAALGLAEDDDIMGFLYIGTEVGSPSTIPRPDAKDFVTHWAG